MFKRDKSGKFIKGGGSLRSGRKNTPEHNLAISKANKGKPATPSAFKKGDQIRLGMHHTEESKKKISEWHKEHQPKGEKHPLWRGGTFVRNGYIYRYAPDNPHSHQKYYAEHRLVIEGEIGRFLEPTEHVHHIDGNRSNNKFENLLLISGGSSEHNRFHQENWFKKGHKGFPRKSS